MFQYRSAAAAEAWVADAARFRTGAATAEKELAIAWVGGIVGVVGLLGGGVGKEAMIKHNCRGSRLSQPVLHTVFFTDPGEPAIPIEGAVTYQRPSLWDGMDCPLCGAAVPYEIYSKPNLTTVSIDGLPPLFEEVAQQPVTVDSSGVIEIPEPL